MDKYETEDVPEVLPDTLPSGLEGIGKGLGIGGQPLNVSKSLLGAASAAPVAPVVQAQPTSLQSVNSLSATLNQMQALNQPQLQPSVFQHASLSSTGLGLGISGLDRSAYNSGQSLGNSGLGQAQPQQTLSSYPAYQTPLRNTSVGGLGSLQAPISTGGAVYTGPSGFTEKDYRAVQQTPTDTVIVRNLPQTANWQGLRDRFSDIGEVRYAEMKGVGVGVVRFQLERDAQRAVQMMNGSQFDNRLIEVGLYF